MFGMGRLWLLVSEGTIATLFGILIILGTSVTLLATFVFLISLWTGKVKVKVDRQKN